MDISCRSLFCCPGGYERADFDRAEALRIFRGAFLRRNSFPSFCSCEWNKGENGKFLGFFLKGLALPII